MSAYKDSSLWKMEERISRQCFDYRDQSQRVIQAYELFRERIKHLLEYPTRKGA